MHHSTRTEYLRLKLKPHLHSFFATHSCFECILMNSDPLVVAGALVDLLLNLNVPCVAVDRQQQFFTPL
jgi:hypothetical protein